MYDLYIWKINFQDVNFSNEYLHVLHVQSTRSARAHWHTLPFIILDLGLTLCFLFFNEWDFGNQATVKNLVGADSIFKFNYFW